MKRSLKLIAAVLAVVSMLSLAACSSGESNSSASSAADSSAADSSAAESSAEGESSAAEDESSAEDVSSEEESALTATDIAQSIMAEVEFPSMAEIKEDRINDYYDIDLANVDSCISYICGSGARADELAIFMMKSAEAADAAEKVLNDRAANQKETFENYNLDEVYKFDDNNVARKGNSVAIIITTDNKKVKSLFESYAQ